MRLSAILFAAVLGATAPAFAMPAFAMPAAAAEAAATAHDPAKVAVVAQILDNLHTVDIAIKGGERSLRSDPTIMKMAPADQDLIIKLFDDEMQKRHSAMITAMAEDNSDRFTIDQLNDILTFSRIKYAQDVCFYAADPTGPMPDPNSMTAQERADFSRIGDAPYTADFLDNFNFSSETAYVSEAVVAAVQRFVAMRASHG